MEAISIFLKDLGWDESWESIFASYASRGLKPARVTAVFSHQLEVHSDEGRYLLARSGKLSYEALYAAQHPAVGDFVAIEASSSGGILVREVLSRRSCLSRQEVGGPEAQVIAANVDVALIIQSLSGDYNLSRAQRYLAMVWEAGITPLIILSKSDELGPEEAEEKLRLMEANCPGTEVIPISALTGDGMDILSRRLLSGKTFVAMGSSGVGKSTLLNAMMGREIMATQAVREDDQRGRHTTTHRQMFLLPQGSVFVDTPGMREFGLFSFGGVSEAFPDVVAVASGCRFRDCRHQDEPGCAVRGAIEHGELDEKRWSDYVKLQNEEQHFAAKQILLQKKIANANKKRKKTHYKDHIRGVTRSISE